MIVPDVPVEDAGASSNDRYERSLRNDGDRQWTRLPWPPANFSTLLVRMPNRRILPAV